MKKYEKYIVALLGSTFALSTVSCSILPDTPDNYVENKEVSFNVESNEGGSVEILEGKRDIYYIGDEVTVKAVAYEHYKFAGWVNTYNNKESTEIVSTNVIYTFKLADNTNLEAIFYVKTNLPVYAHVPVEGGEIILYYGAKEEGDYTWLNLTNISWDHYTFHGWYLDEAYTLDLNATNLETYLSADPTPTEIHIYGNLTHNTIEVTFKFYVINGEIEEITDESVTNPNVGPFYEGKMLNLKDPSKAENETYEYIWKGWYTDESLTTEFVDAEINESITLYGKFQRHNISKHTITWRVDGFEKEVDEKVIYGSHPSYDGETPSKEATAQYTYTFAGWKIEGTEDSEIIDLSTYEVTDSVTFEAVFTSKVNSYTVKFVDYDGTTVLKSETLEYGATPTAPTSTPNHGGLSVDPRDSKSFYDDDNLYTFTGWDKEISSVTGETTYTAQYSERTLLNYSYTIKVVGELLNGFTWTGTALECHETIFPNTYTYNSKIYSTTYYMDEAMTTPLTDEKLLAAWKESTSQTFYVELGVANLRYVSSTDDIGSSNAASRVGLDENVLSVTGQKSSTSSGCLTNVGLSSSGITLHRNTGVGTGNILTIAIKDGVDGIIEKIILNTTFSKDNLTVDSNGTTITAESDSYIYNVNSKNVSITNKQSNVFSNKDCTITNIIIYYYLNA